MDEGAVVDEVLKSLKWNGIYQITRSTILFITLTTFAFHSESVVFIGKSVDHRCRRLQSLNVTVDSVTYDIMSNRSDVYFNVTYGECSIDVTNGNDVVFTTNCVGGYEYLDSEKSSFVSEWDLVCDRESLSDTTQTIFVAGEMFGSFFLTRFSDTHGRKKSFLVTSFMSFVTSVICSFPPNFVFYLVFKFAFGAFSASSRQLAFVMIIEMMPHNRRALPEQIESFLWTAAVLIMCFIAYITQHLSWHYTQLILSLTSVYVLIQGWFTDESLRWLCEVKKYTEVEMLVQKMARINRVDPEKSLNLLKKNVFSASCHDNEKTQSEVDKKKIVNQDKKLSSFIKNSNLLKITIITSFIWFVDALAYDGLLMISPDLTDDFYLGFVLGVVIEFPATIIFCLLIDRIGRKNCTNIFHPVAGVFLLVSTVLLNTPLSDIIPGHYWFSLVLSLLGRLSLSTAYSASNIYVPELFPTSVRNTGFGIAGIFSFLGSTIAPYTRTLSRHVPWAPGAVISSLCLLIPVTTRILPETKGHELTQTLDDLDKIMNKKIIFETKL